MSVIDSPLGNMKKRPKEASDWTPAWAKFGPEDTEEG